MFDKYIVSDIPISPTIYNKCMCPIALPEQVAYKAKFGVLLDAIFKPIMLVKPYKIELAISFSNFSFWKNMCIRMKWTLKIYALLIAS
jgi:hypothetical protein